MARRNLRIGDDLSGRKLYFTLSETDETAIDSLTATKEQFIMATMSNWSISTGGNSYSLGSRYYTGLYNPSQYDYVLEGSLWTEFPELSLITWSNYSGGSMAVENGPFAEIDCPIDVGTIWWIDTNSPLYPYLEIDDSEFPASVFIGDTRVSEIYLGTEKISSLFDNLGQCGGNFFVLNGWEWFLFESGQTWQEWIDQGKYWEGETEWDIWSYSGNTVYHGQAPLSNATPADAIEAYRVYDAGLACLSEDTLIQTINGNKAISTLEIGDKLTDDNQVEKIVKHNRTYYYEITLDNNDIIKASNDHQFICNNNIVKTEDLQINDKLNNLTIVNINRINESLDMYEIKTSTNQYTLFNGIICESENI